MSGGAQRFAQTRRAHRSEIAQDYVEVVLELEAVSGKARLTDVASRLGVAHPTASKALGKLVAQGLVTNQPYKGFMLTESGRALAEQCRARHHTVVRFLVAIGVDPAVAEEDAEGIEHHVSKDTLTAMYEFLAAM